MGHSDAHCCLCGAPRRPTQAPVGSFGNNVECLSIADYRPLQNERWEARPQLLINVVMWRNGGVDSHTHMCDDCIVIGLKAAKKFVDGALEGLTASASSHPLEGK